MAGTCYKSAYFGVIDNPELKDWTVCHGFPLVPSQGGRIGHAWIESPDGNTAIDTETGRACFRDLLYAKYAIEPDRVYRYSFMQALDLVWLYEHFGPWDPDPYPDVRYAN